MFRLTNRLAFVQSHKKFVSFIIRIHWQLFWLLLLPIFLHL